MTDLSWKILVYIGITWRVQWGVFYWRNLAPAEYYSLSLFKSTDGVQTSHKLSMKAHTILMYPISYLSLWYLRQLSLPLLPSSQTWETSNHCLPCFISTTNQREFSEYKNCFSPYTLDKQTLPLVEVPAYLSPSTSYSDSLRLLACKQEVVLRGRKEYVY